MATLASESRAERFGKRSVSNDAKHKPPQRGVPTKWGLERPQRQSSIRIDFERFIPTRHWQPQLPGEGPSHPKGMLPRKVMRPSQLGIPNIGTRNLQL